MAMSFEDLKAFAAPLLQEALREKNIDLLVAYRDEWRESFLPIIAYALETSIAEDQLFTKLMDMDANFCYALLKRPEIAILLQQSLPLCVEILRAAQTQAGWVQAMILPHLTQINPNILTTPLTLNPEDLHSSFLHQAISHNYSHEFQLLSQQELWVHIPPAYQLFLQAKYPEYFKNLPVLTKPLVQAPSIATPEFYTIPTESNAPNPELTALLMQLYKLTIKGEHAAVAQLEKTRREELNQAFANIDCRNKFLERVIENEETSLLTKTAQLYPNFLHEPYDGIERRYATFFEFVTINKIEFALLWFLTQEHLLQDEQIAQLKITHKALGKETLSALCNHMKKNDFGSLSELCQDRPATVRQLLNTPKAQKKIIKIFFEESDENDDILEALRVLEPTLLSALVVPAIEYSALNIIDWILTPPRSKNISEDQRIALEHAQTAIEQELPDTEQESEAQAQRTTAGQAAYATSFSKAHVQNDPFEDLDQLTSINQLPMAELIFPASSSMDTDVADNHFDINLSTQKFTPLFHRRELKPGDSGFKGYAFDLGLNGEMKHETDALTPFWLLQFSAPLEAQGYALMDTTLNHQELEPAQVQAVLNGQAFLRITSYDFDNAFSIPEEKAFSRPLQTLIYPINLNNYHYGCLVLHFSETNEIKNCFYFEPLSQESNGGFRPDLEKLLAKLVQSGSFGNATPFQVPIILYMGQKDDIYCGDYVTATLETFIQQKINLYALMEISAHFAEISQETILLNQMMLTKVAECQTITNPDDLSSRINTIIAGTLDAQQALTERTDYLLNQSTQVLRHIQQRALSCDEIEFIRSLMVVSLGFQQYTAQLHPTYQPRDEAHLRANFETIKARIPELAQRVAATLRLQFDAESVSTPVPMDPLMTAQPFLEQSIHIATQGAPGAITQVENGFDHPI